MSANAPPPDHPDDFEDRVVDEIGHVLLVQTERGIEQRANTPKNALLYRYGMYDFLNNREGIVVLSDDSPYAAVAPTRNENVYTIWFGEADAPPVENPPSKSVEVLSGVRDALDGDLSTLQEVVQWIRDNQVRRDVIDLLLPYHPVNSVQPTDEGWIIEGLFLITWDARVFLVSDDPEGETYRRSSDGVTTTAERQEFLSLLPETIPEQDTFEVNGREVELGELEMLFLLKVQWLLRYDEMYDDETFWNLIRRHIVTGQPAENI